MADPLDPLTNDEVSILLQETHAMHDGNSTKHAKSIFAQNAAAAAQTIVKIALLEPNAKLRYDASKYVVERNLGPIAGVTEDEKSTIQQLYEDLANADL